MKCANCLEREADGLNALCTKCDLEEWKDATKRANKRFQRAESLLRQMHSASWRFIESVDGKAEYKTTPEEMIEELIKRSKTN
jgi:hypothetical protein